MKNITVPIVFLLFSFCSYGQNYTEDSLQLVQTIDWLQRKLNYNYYNGDDTEWWTNRFSWDPVSGKVNIRNISSEQLGGITERTHLHRTCFFKDLNPYTIRIDEQSEHSGRLVKGKLIRVETYQHARVIKQTTNGRISSDQSFLYFSIPQIMEDSLRGFAESIAEKLKQAILLSSKVYPAGTFQGNFTRLFDVIEGRFLSKDARCLEAKRLFEGVVEISLYNAEKELLGKGFLQGEGQNVRWTMIRPGRPVEVEKLVFGTGREFGLSGEDFYLVCPNRNEIRLPVEGTEAVFIRDHSYMGDGASR